MQMIKKGRIWHVRYKKHMSRRAKYCIVVDTPDVLRIEDIGEHDLLPTITNDAEGVVARLAKRVGKRRLEYIDSEGAMDLLLIKDGKFAGFAPGGPVA